MFCGAFCPRLPPPCLPPRAPRARHAPTRRASSGKLLSSPITQLRDGGQSAMLKRRGGRNHPPTSTNKRPRVQPASRLLQENVFAWRSAADLPARERAALDHFAQLKEQPHKQCQICQEAIRARLQHESLRARAQPVATIPRRPRAAAAVVVPPPTPTPTPPTPTPTPPTPGSDTYGFGSSESSIFSGASPDPTVSSTVSSDGTLPGTGGALYERQPLHWADVGKEVWEEYWHTWSDVSAATTASRHCGRVPDGFVERARSIAAGHTVRTLDCRMHWRVSSLCCCRGRPGASCVSGQPDGLLRRVRCADVTMHDNKTPLPFEV